MQTLRWTQVRWEKGHRRGAYYQCEACGEAIYERAKLDLLAAGEWRATAEGEGLAAGFHLSALYSPFETWAEIAVEHGRVYRDPSRLRAWINLKLGEPFEDRASQIPEPALIMARCESWGAGLPDGVAILTGGVEDAAHEEPSRSNFNGAKPGVPDGMKVDNAGNVYCGGSGGIWILDAKGKKLGRIVHGQPQTTNLAFGGADWKTLYFTNARVLGSVNLKIAGNPVPALIKG
jgi:hypothetical protein